MNDEVAKLRSRAEKDGVEFYFALFVDMHGKPCAKMIPVESTDVLVEGEAGFAGFAAGPMGHTPADGDLIAIPDLDTYTVLPWKRTIAIVMCDIFVEGEPWPFCPRLILKDAIAKGDPLGMRAAWAMLISGSLNFAASTRRNPSAAPPSYGFTQTRAVAAI